MINTSKLISISVADVNMYDRPDFSDAWLEEAWSLELNRWLTHEELVEVTEIDDGFVNQYIHENLDLYL